MAKQIRAFFRNGKCFSDGSIEIPCIKCGEVMLGFPNDDFFIEVTDECEDDVSVAVAYCSRCWTGPRFDRSKT